MTVFNRRTLMKGAAAAGVLSGSGLTEWAKAWAQAAPFRPEQGATLNLLRWRRFVEAEDAQFNRMVAAFTQATGVRVSFCESRISSTAARTTFSCRNLVVF